MEPVTIGKTHMSGATSGHTADFHAHAGAGGDGAWVSTRCPGRLLTRMDALSSLVLAEMEEQGQGGSEGAGLLRAELGLP
jgi:hypothetical protein